jgi:uncharacterized membrane protein YpjA
MKIKDIFENKNFLILLSIINVAGFIFGIYYYYEQLSITPFYLWVFVIDCPLYVLLFALILLMKLRKKTSDMLNFFTSVGLIKYGIWTGLTIFLYRDFFFSIDPVLYSVIIPLHIGMILEGTILIPFEKPDVKIAFSSALWFLFNDYMDYFIGTMPLIPKTHKNFLMLESFLSSIMIIMIIFLIKRKNR